MRLAVLAIRTPPTWPLRVDGDPLTDPRGVDAVPDRRDPAGGLVSENDGAFDHDVPDITGLEEVGVGAATADRGDADEHLTGTGTGYVAALQPDGLRGDEDTRQHG